MLPIVEGKKGEKLSAKELITRQHLREMHPQMEAYVSNVLGHHVDIINGATREGNKSLEEFKRGKAKKDLENAKVKLDEAIEYKKKIEAAEIEFNVKKAFSESLKEQPESFDRERIEEHFPEYRDPNHYFKVPADIMKTQFRTLELHTDISKSFDEMISRAEEITKIKRENSQLKTENKKLKEELCEKDNLLKRVSRVLDKIAEKIPNLREPFDKALAAVKKEELVEAQEEATIEKSFQDIEYEY